MSIDVEKIKEQSNERIQAIADEYVEYIAPLIENAAREGYRGWKDKMFKEEYQSQPEEHRILFRHPEGVEEISNRLPGFEVFMREKPRRLFNDLLGPEKYLVIRW